jgi:NADPH-dependent curcumin reductase CurA
MQGFIVFDYAKKYAEAYQQLGQWFAEGKLKSKHTIIKGGLKNGEEALLKLFEGHNIGRSAPFDWTWLETDYV